MKPVNAYKIGAQLRPEYKDYFPSRPRYGGKSELPPYPPKPKRNITDSAAIRIHVTVT